VTEARKDAAEWAALTIVAPARWSQKRFPESDAALARLKETSADTAAYQIAEVHAYRGEKDQAFEWLERARQQRDPGLQGTTTDPLFVNLHSDPRWQAFLHMMGMADAQGK
jgi:hypothetical protein